MIRWLAGGTAALLAGLAGATGVTGLGLTPTPSSGSGRAGGFTVPLTSFSISQGFGCTPLAMEPARPSCVAGHWHSGVDLAAPWGEPVRSTLAGTAQVLHSGTGYGLHIIVDHGGGMSSLYGHLSSVTITDGSTVATGTTIGAVGSTGNSTGPHLHFEIRRAGIPEDPAIDVSLS